MEFSKDAIIQKLKTIKKRKVVTLIDEKHIVYGTLELKSTFKKGVSWTYQYNITVGSDTYDLIEISKPFSFTTTSMRVTKGQEYLFDSAWNFNINEYSSNIYPIRGDFKFHTQSGVFSSEINPDLLQKNSTSFKLLSSQPIQKLYTWLDSDNSLVLRSIDGIETILDLAEEDIIAFIFFVYCIRLIPEKKIFHYIVIDFLLVCLILYFFRELF